MAVFDNRESNKITLDDTQPLTCLIEAAESNQGHTVYILKVQRVPFLESTWYVRRRYSDFDVLNNMLLYSGLELPLPPKKVFGKLEREFIAERQQALQNYIDYILSHPFLSVTLCVKRFFDPTDYAFNFSETSLQHVSMVFRSETNWEVVGPLQELGWRIRKQFFLAKPKNDIKTQSLLSWTSFGPDNILSEKDMTVAVKLFGNIKHPFIYSPLFINISDNGALVIYDFLENGSLRDILYKVKPKEKFLKKYGKPKLYDPLPVEKIQKYGRQILLALKFLHERSLFFGHLHSGNVIIINDVCKLIELESSILGIPSLLRPYFSQLRKVQTTENIDIYCFGHVIYEMAFGKPLQECSSTSFPVTCTPELRSILEAILTTEACKKGLPSASDLLLHPFFNNVPNCPEEKFHLKVSTLLKESLKKAKEKIESRLKDEQRVIRRQQRVNKTHLSLDDDKKKKSHERRKPQKSISQDRAENGLVSPQTPSANGINLSGITNQPVFAPSPPLPPPPPPPPPPIAISNNIPSTNKDRSALLNSIQGFNKGKLKKSETKDNSAPKF